MSPFTPCLSLFSPFFALFMQNENLSACQNVSKGLSVIFFIPLPCKLYYHAPINVHCIFRSFLRLSQGHILPNFLNGDHRLNMKADLQSLFGLHVTWCAQLYSLAETPHWDPYTRAVLVSKDWRHLFVTLCRRPYPTFSCGLSFHDPNILFLFTFSRFNLSSFLNLNPFSPIQRLALVFFWFPRNHSKDMNRQARTYSTVL